MNRLLHIFGVSEQWKSNVMIEWKHARMHEYEYILYTYHQMAYPLVHKSSFQVRRRMLLDKSFEFE